MRCTSSHPARALALSAALLPAALGVSAATLAAQRMDASRADSSRLVGRAHDDQASFEHRRLLLLPRAPAGDGCEPSGGTLGRFCFQYHEDWHPRPETEAIRLLRARLLARLDSIGALVPGDAWILGQRVWYRAEAGRWRGALRVARGCGIVEPWWCFALQGFVLHGLGRYPAAERAFTTALSLMDTTRSRAWRIPRKALDGGTTDWLEHASADSLSSRLRRLWTLADPLYLVPGNDRETAHYARRTVSLIRERAVNPYLVSWGRDLEELMIRYGWEIGWERPASVLAMSGLHGAVGHQPRQARTYLPSLRDLRSPGSASATDLEAAESDGRSSYTPAYAPVLLPMTPQVALFPRGDSFTVVATAFLPPDTTTDGEPSDSAERVTPLLGAGGWVGRPDRAGLFLVPVAGGPPQADTVRSGKSSGAFLIEAPAGRWILSAESWSPSALRAGRYRTGLSQDSLSADVPALSDLLLLHADGTEPRSLRAALPRVLVSPVVHQEERVAVAWELTGLGWRSETVTYRLSVDGANDGFLDKAGRWLHLTHRRRPLVLSWKDPESDRLDRRFHWLALHLPKLSAGRYEIRLEARIPGRSELVSRRAFRVDDRDSGPARDARGAPHGDEHGHR